MPLVVAPTILPNLSPEETMATDIARPDADRLSQNTDRKSRWTNALLCIVLATLGTVSLFSYEIYFFVAHGVNFFDVLASAVQHAEGFFPAP
jgi:hypothetical protein